MALASCAVVIVITCDKPFEPVEPKDYPFYTANLNPTSQLFVFHPISNKVDSVEIPGYAYPGLTVSADGKLLYIAQGTSVVVVETDSFNYVTELMYPQEYPVEVSPDNRLIALTGDDLYVLRTSDYSLVFSDTSETIYGNFSSDSRDFYCSSRISQDSAYLVYNVDLSDSLFPITRKSFAGRSVVHVVPSIDETKWFLYSNVALWTSAFEVYDAINDTIIFTDILVPGSGSIAMTPDGRYVFYTSPGGTGTDPPPDNSFTIFDVGANQIDTIIKDRDFFSDSGWVRPPSIVSVSPDGKWLGMLGGQGIYGSFYLYDIEKKKLVYRKVSGTRLYEFVSLSV